MPANGPIAWLVAAVALTLSEIVHPQVATAQSRAAPTYKAGISEARFGSQGKPVFFDDTLTKQFEDAMSGGVDSAQRLRNGAAMIATCRPRNCPDKAAAIVAQDGQLVAAGMV